MNRSCTSYEGIPLKIWVSRACFSYQFDSAHSSSMGIPSWRFYRLQDQRSSDTRGSKRFREYWGDELGKELCKIERGDKKWLTCCCRWSLEIRRSCVLGIQRTNEMPTWRRWWLRRQKSKSHKFKGPKPTSSDTINIISKRRDYNLWKRNELFRYTYTFPITQEVSIPSTTFPEPSTPLLFRRPRFLPIA